MLTMGVWWDSQVEKNSIRSRELVRFTATRPSRDGGEAEHFDAEHSHDKFESHGTKNAGALPDKAGLVSPGMEDP